MAIEFAMLRLFSSPFKGEVRRGMGCLPPIAKNGRNSNLAPSGSLLNDNCEISSL